MVQTARPPCPYFITMGAVLQDILWFTLAYPEQKLPDLLAVPPSYLSNVLNGPVEALMNSLLLGQF